MVLLSISGLRAGQAGKIKLTDRMSRSTSIRAPSDRRLIPEDIVRIDRDPVA